MNVMEIHRTITRWGRFRYDVYYTPPDGKQQKVRARIPFHWLARWWLRRFDRTGTIYRCEETCEER